MSEYGSRNRSDFINEVADDLGYDDESIKQLNADLTAGKHNKEGLTAWAYVAKNAPGVKRTGKPLTQSEAETLSVEELKKRMDAK